MIKSIAIAFCLSTIALTGAAHATTSQSSTVAPAQQLINYLNVRERDPVTGQFRTRADAEAICETAADNRRLRFIQMTGPLLFTDGSSAWLCWGAPGF
jgi:hypothetical protein